MLKLQAYSEKGIVIEGAGEPQAKRIAAALGPSVCTSHNPKLGGWVFSRKREDRIKSIVEAMNAEDDGLPGKWGVLAEPEAERIIHVSIMPDGREITMVRVL